MLSDDLLKHVGVTGMRWGIRRNRNRPGGADGVKEATKPKGTNSETVKDKRGKLTKNLDSMKRERKWKEVLKDMDKLSTKDITVIDKRVKLENSLKTLSKSPVAKSKDKEDYLRRDKMDDSELARKVVRLRAKDSLHKTVKDASKEQREFGEKVIQIASSLGIKYAITRTKLTPKDLFDAVTDSKKASNSAKKLALEKAGVKDKDDIESILKKLESKS